MINPDAYANLQDAITTITEASMVTRWVLIAEVIDDNGERNLADLTSPDLAYWDVAGMCTATIQGRETQPMWSYDEDE